MDDGYDYFSFKNQHLQTSNGKSLKKYLTNDDHTLDYEPLQTVPRDRLYKRQSLAENQRVEGQNKSIVLNDGNVDRMIIGYSKGAF